MTISSDVRVAGPFVGNDTATVFPFAFKVFVGSDLLVVKLDVATGVESVLVITTDYTVTLNANQDVSPGGSITLPSVLASGKTLTVTSDIAELQPTDITNQGGFYPSVITKALDRLTILVQQLRSAVSRSLTLPLSTPSGVSTELPFPSASKLIGWDGTAAGLQNYDAATFATLVAYGTANADIFTGNGVQTVFALSANPGVLNNLDVSISGVTKRPGLDYTWSSGTNITFVSPPAASANNVLVRYMQGLAAPDQPLRGEIAASAGAALIGWISSAVSAVATNVAAWIGWQPEHLYNFCTVAQITDIRTRAATLNLAAPLQALVTAVATRGGGVGLLPEGKIRIDSAVTLPGNVTLAGKGCGRNLQPAITAATEIAWYGGATAMLKFGYGASTVVGGGLQNVRLDGRVLATNCIAIKDQQHGYFCDLVMVGATNNAALLENSAAFDPTSFNVFSRVQISLRGGSTNAANGIYLNGTGTGADGVTLNEFRKLRIEHANGSGLVFGDRADGNTFYDYFAYRANTTETGYGVLYTVASTTAVNSTNAFLGNTIMVGGFAYVAPSGPCTLPSVGCYYGGVNTIELASDITDRNNPSRGNARDLARGNTIQSYSLGLSRIRNEMQGSSYDAMRYINFNSTTLILVTSDGNWRVARTGTGVCQSAAQAGGAVELATSAAIGDAVAIYSSSDFTSGITRASNPFAMFNATPATGTAGVIQFGMFGDATVPNATDGIYVEADTVTNANFRLICRAAGVNTAIVTTIPVAVAKRQWLIMANSDAVIFMTKLPTDAQWTYLGTTTSGVPSVALAAGFRVYASTAAARSAHIYHAEFGHDHE